jgi:hypothetical protein
MFVSAMLCGAALAGLLFVGVWRHTAGEAASSKAAQRSDHRALAISRRTVAALTAKLSHEQALLAGSRSAGAATSAALARARGSLAEAQAALAHAKAAGAAALESANARAASLSTDANAIARATATLRSELAALETYAQNPGPTGIDPGYLANQVRYLESSAAAAESAANDLVRRSRPA